MSKAVFGLGIANTWNNAVYFRQRSEGNYLFSGTTRVLKLREILIVWMGHERGGYQTGFYGYTAHSCLLVHVCGC